MHNKHSFILKQALFFLKGNLIKKTEYSEYYQLRSEKDKSTCI